MSHWTDDPLCKRPTSVAAGSAFCQQEDFPKQNKIKSPIEVTKSALLVQEGGDHYKKMPIQPVEYIHANHIPFMEGCIIKYISRWKNKGGIQDLEKAKHFINLLIELESKSK